MAETVQRTTADHDRRHRRIWRGALLASVLLHVLLFLLFREDILIPPSPFAAAGPRSGDASAAAGGGTRIVALTVVETPPDPVEQVVPIPVPTPEPEVELVVEEPPTPQLVVATAPVQGTGTVGQGRGERTGEGIEGGTGRGDGGTAEAGLNRGVVPPMPRGLILPPSDRPGSVRGKEVDVWVFVTAGGRVLEDSTRIAPPTGDRRFDDRLKKQAAEWVFEPARRAGAPIAEWFRYTIIL